MFDCIWLIFIILYNTTGMSQLKVSGRVLFRNPKRYTYIYIYIYTCRRGEKYRSIVRQFCGWHLDASQSNITESGTLKCNRKQKTTFQKHKHNDRGNHNHTAVVLQTQRFSGLENCHMPWVLTFLGVFAKLPKELLASSCMYVRPSFLPYGTFRLQLEGFL